MGEIDAELLEELRRACDARRGSLHPDYAQGLLKRCLEVLEPRTGAPVESYRPDRIVARALMAARFGNVL